MKKGIIPISFTILILLLTSIFSYILANDKSHALTKEQWLQDLNFVVKTLRNRHPNLFYRVSELEFQKVVKTTKEKILKAESYESSAITIIQLVSFIEDGHTRLSLNECQQLNSYFPIRFYKFTDGIFITAIDRENAKYVGSKVVKIGDVSAEQAFEMCMSLVFADNKFRSAHYASAFLSNGGMLNGLDILDSPQTLTIQLIDNYGSKKELKLKALAPNYDFRWRNSPITGPGNLEYVSAFSEHEASTPLHLLHLNSNYWYTLLKKERTVYMQFNLIIEQEEESFEGFRNRMWKEVDAHADNIEYFILDLRYNTGGNGLMVMPFLNEIIKRDFINRKGHFFTLIGRVTNSAAVLFMAELAMHTKTLFVGEPSGAAFNMFSDARLAGKLPNSGLNFNIATEYFNFSWPANNNYTVIPHYPTPFSSDDFFSGKDPALEAVMSGKIKTVETVLNEQGPVAALKHFEKLNYKWDYYSDEWGIFPFESMASPKYKEGEINNLGYSLMQNGKLDDAIAAFELNCRLFHQSFNTWDSLAEAYKNKGENELAIKYYRRSLELNPANENAKEMLEKLKKKFQIPKNKFQINLNCQ